MSQPTLTREGIASALFTLLQTIPGVLTFSRRLAHYSEVPPDQQPAVYLTSGPQVPTQDASGLPTRWTFHFMVVIYVTNANDQAVPSTGINNLLDALEAVLRPTTFQGPPGFPGTVQVLGDTTGRIRHAWISGPIETDEGMFGDQAFAYLPLEVEFV